MMKMTRPPLVPATLVVFRVVLGALFVFAGVVKLGDGAGFALEIANYRMLPFASLAPWLAVTLPGIEIAAGAALLVGTRPWLRAGALIVGALLVVFTVAVTQVVLRGINIQCGCFGGDAGPVTWVTIMRDVVLLAMAAAVYVMSAPRSEPTRT